MRKKATIIFPVLLGLLIAFAGNAQPRGGKHMAHGPKTTGMQREMRGPENPVDACFDLGLSDTQINRLIDMQADLMKRQIPMLKRMHELGQELGQERGSSDPNTDRVRELMDEMGKIRTDLAVSRMEARKTALEILTPEQRDRLGDRPVPFIGGPMGMGGPMMRQPPVVPGDPDAPAPPPGIDPLGK